MNVKRFKGDIKAPTENVSKVIIDRVDLLKFRHVSLSEIINLQILFYCTFTQINETTKFTLMLQTNKKRCDVKRHLKCVNEFPRFSLLYKGLLKFYILPQQLFFFHSALICFSVNHLQNE